MLKLEILLQGHSLKATFTRPVVQDQCFKAMISWLVLYVCHSTANTYYHFYKSESSHFHHAWCSVTSNVMLNWLPPSYVCSCCAKIVTLNLHLQQTT